MPHTHNRGAMKISGTPADFRIGGHILRLRRIAGGVMEIIGRDDLDFARGLGFAHAYDRGLQMMITRLVAQGRLSECLADNDETLLIDISMREMAFARQAALEVGEMTEDARRFAEAYCEGVNTCIQARKIPLELKIAGYRPEPWNPEDILTAIRLLSYLGLAQTQQDAEKFIIQALAAGVPLEVMRVLFSPWLDEVDEKLVELLKQIRIERPLWPPTVKSAAVLPMLLSSNNWALAGHRTVSGGAFQCNDPHLECNRLPAIWYEVVAYVGDDFRAGITMPGLPGLIMGRTSAISTGFTYGFMDMVDYFVEEVRGGRFRRGSSFEDFNVRTERILRKRGRPVEITVRENLHGVLESDSRTPVLEDGFYLCRAYSNHRSGALASLDTLRMLPLARSVDEASAALHGFAISFNFVLADKAGNIAYRQTGRLPRRCHSGLHPVEGWEEGNDWKGFVDDRELTRFDNPTEGFIITANNDMDRPGHPKAINLPMGSYRAERIRSLLAGERRLDLDEMKRIQTDLYSLQAERFMERLRPLLPDAPAARMLAEWDLRYDRSSRGATVFEECYRALLDSVFGENVFGAAIWRLLCETTIIPHVYYHVFDNILLGQDRTPFFGPEGQEALYRRVLARVLTSIDPVVVRRWGEVQQFTMKNLFWGGRLPRFVGYDHGPVPLAGCRATVVQCLIFHAQGRLVGIYPSYRYITDLSVRSIHSVLAGGPSDRRFSGHYLTDIRRWLHGEYKELKLGKP